MYKYSCIYHFKTHNSLRAPVKLATLDCLTNNLSLAYSYQVTGEKF